MKQFKLIPNTDAVDIRDKCLGLNVSYSEVSKLEFDRGLHIQIRHNGDKAAFREANRISQVISATPELLAVCEHGIKELMRAYQMTSKLETQDHEFGVTLNELVMRLNENFKSAVAKARGES